MNRCFLSLFAASRIRSSALGTLSRLWVRSVLLSGGFPLASPLPSTTSASDGPDLFSGFPGTTELSDFPASFIIDVNPVGFLDTICDPIAADDVGISRLPCEMRPYMPGSQTARSPSASRDIDAVGVAFRPSPKRRRSEVNVFRGSMAGLYFPLSTLHRRSCERRCMTRG